MTNAAIQFNTEPFDAAVARPMGRHSAGEGFLRGFLKHADVEAFHFWDHFGQDRAAMDALVQRLGPPTRPVIWLERNERERFADAGALHIPTPELAYEAWARRALGATAHSLTGVTHTISETHIIDEIGNLLLAPLEPWDALICTSEAGRKAVETLLDGVAGYLHDRFGATRIAPAQLVTIPLGLHVDDFDVTAGARLRWRAKLGIPENAPVALHLGRFSTNTKMHPGPMGIALQQAAQRLGVRVYWVMFGGARRPEDEEAFVRAAGAFCPDVEICVVDDRSAAARDEIPSAADLFLSLSDNTQETFGITPLEAMAAGLPCVVSDWDGYRDTVRHGLDGFRVRTMTPKPGLGSDLAYAHAHRLISYDTFAGASALLTAVDIGEAADALVALFADPDLRAKMGQSGRTRARDTFDWRVVIPQYQALWGELARRRRAAPVQGPLENPYRPDPFRMFQAYPTAALSGLDMVALWRPFGEEEVTAWLEAPGARNEAARLPTAGEVANLVSRLAAGPRSVSALLAEISTDRRPYVERGLVWLAKFGVLRLGGGSPRT
jgi:glycosyltransferase involved in cell wall biosynthesis